MQFTEWLNQVPMERYKAHMLGFISELRQEWELEQYQHIVPAAPDICADADFTDRVIYCLQEKNKLSVRDAGFIDVMYSYLSTLQAPSDKQLVWLNNICKQLHYDDCR